VAEQATVTVPGAVALGIGSIVGAGIFALLGEGAALAGSAVWLSFLAAGIVALLTGYSFVQLGIRYPSRGGVVEYLVQAYGIGVFSGACSILFYFTQLIGMSMLALAFGKYSVKLFGLEDQPGLLQQVFGSGLVISLAALQLFGSSLIKGAQRIIVITNLLLLAGVAIGLSSVGDSGRLATENWPPAAPILGSLALTFFAYNGFAVVANAVESMHEPARDLPRAMFLTIGIVIVLYVGLALATTVAVTPEQLISSGPLLLVEAARSAFGDTAFTVLLFSAVVATITCINGGLYGMASITFTLAEKGQLPARFGREVAASTRGLTISAALSLIMLNLMDLTTVASLGSATSLSVYLLVNFGAFRLIKDNAGKRAVILCSVLACLTAIIVWCLYTIKYSPHSLIIFAVFVVIALFSELLLQKVNRRKIVSHT